MSNQSGALPSEEAVMFEPQSLVAAAASAAGSDDLWGDGYREPLEVLSNSILREAGLHPGRARRMAGLITQILATRARIAATLTGQRDAITRTSIERPIFIAGLPRTGTTMLHGVLAGVQGLRAYSPWEMRCVAPAHIGPDWREKARADTAAILQALYQRSPDLTKIHLMTVDGPDECNWLIRHSLASVVFGYMFHVPSYLRWLFGRPQLRAYSEHRVQLQILAHREPADARTRLILKDPGHLWHLRELFDTYPDALVVRLHRDPVEAVPSLCSMMHAFQRTDSGREDPRQVGALALEMVELGLERERTARASQRPQRILDIEFRDLMNDPIAVVTRICQCADHPFDEPARARATEWLRDNPRHKIGRHVYTAAEFGLDEGELRERLGDHG